MEIINLNTVQKICLIKRRKTHDYVWRETCNFKEWFLNKFRKNKVKERYITNGMWEVERFNSADEFNKEYGTKYWCYPIGEQIYEKAHINIWYEGYSCESRYFDSDNEAKDYFTKLRTYIKEHNVPFIDFYSDL